MSAGAVAVAPPAHAPTHGRGEPTQRVRARLPGEGDVVLALRQVPVVHRAARVEVGGGGQPGLQRPFWSVPELQHTIGRPAPGGTYFLRMRANGCATAPAARVGLALARPSPPKSLKYN